MKATCDTFITVHRVARIALAGHTGTLWEAFECTVLFADSSGGVADNSILIMTDGQTETETESEAALAPPNSRDQAKLHFAWMPLEHTRPTDRHVVTSVQHTPSLSLSSLSVNFGGPPSITSYLTNWTPESSFSCTCEYSLTFLFFFTILPDSDSTLISCQLPFNYS